MGLEHSIDQGILRLRGEIDLSNADELTRAIAAAARNGHEVEVDLSGVTFIDSSGLHAIRRAAASENCGPVVLVDVPSKIVRIIEIVGLSRTPSVRMRSRIDG
jgi:anti-anti-sigma factor